MHLVLFLREESSSRLVRLGVLSVRAISKWNYPFFYPSLCIVMQLQLRPLLFVDLCLLRLATSPSSLLYLILSLHHHRWPPEHFRCQYRVRVSPPRERVGNVVLVEVEHCEQRRGMRLKLVGRLQGMGRLEKYVPVGGIREVARHVLRKSTHTVLIQLMLHINTSQCSLMCQQGNLIAQNLRISRLDQKRW